jgi:hypothetical protein
MKISWLARAAETAILTMYSEYRMEEKKPTTSDARPPVLIEGEDYYVENGRWVFTAAYHLKRGYCCSSGCRHCPYGEKDGCSNGEKSPSKNP